MSILSHMIFLVLTYHKPYVNAWEDIICQRHFRYTWV